MRRTPRTRKSIKMVEQTKISEEELDLIYHNKYYKPTMLIAGIPFFIAALTSIVLAHSYFNQFKIAWLILIFTSLFSTAVIIIGLGCGGLEMQKYK